MKILLSLVLTFFSGTVVQAASSWTKDDQALAALHIQDGGRIKPYDTFARESLRLIYGKESFRKMPATRLLLTWMVAPQLWDDQEILEVRYRGLKEALAVPIERNFFKPQEIFANSRLTMLLDELRSKREAREKLNPYFQSISRLQDQLSLYQAIKSGHALRVVPVTEGDTWQSAAEMAPELQSKFVALTGAVLRDLNPEAKGDVSGAVSIATAAEEFKTAARSVAPAQYGDETAVTIEVLYNIIHPFMWAWIIYILAAIVLAWAWHLNRQSWAWAGIGLSVLAFLIHTGAFAIRMYLTGRPPVSNMYESVVWVSWGAVLFALIFEFLHKKKFIMLAGCLVAALCLIVADLAPVILDASLQPLEPVLRSNLWLTVHVLTIAISYSAFFLAWALSLLGLGLILRGEKDTSERVRALVQSIYRSIQVGVVLLAAGIILGGVWADYSWGRFWGWDPKETWALIALLGYLAVLHGRLVGWVKNLGLMVWSVVCLALVIMAWYGVNYVLGAGLHSYGFGAGGVEYVSLFLVLNFIFVGLVVKVHRDRSRGNA